MSYYQQINKAHCKEQGKFCWTIWNWCFSKSKTLPHSLGQAGALTDSEGTGVGSPQGRAGGRAGIYWALQRYFTFWTNGSATSVHPVALSFDKGQARAQGKCFFWFSGELKVWWSAATGDVGKEFCTLQKLLRASTCAPLLTVSYTANSQCAERGPSFI